MGLRGGGSEACGRDQSAPREPKGTPASCSSDASGRRRVSFGTTTYLPTPFSSEDLTTLWEVGPISSSTTADPASGGTTTGDDDDEDGDSCVDLRRWLGVAEARKFTRGLAPRNDTMKPPRVHPTTSSLWKRRQLRDGAPAHAPQ
mmetsp:Transcript_1595/g.4710  ORF Transcript_1595/g.4710 Transcript_1595/m.4710 type:complete len:145 (+) Transcript_1595:94-528(+)